LTDLPKQAFPSAEKCSRHWFCDSSRDRN